MKQNQKKMDVELSSHKRKKSDDDSAQPKKPNISKDVPTVVEEKPRGENQKDEMQNSDDVTDRERTEDTPNIRTQPGLSNEKPIVYIKGKEHNIVAIAKASPVVMRNELYKIARVKDAWYTKDCIKVELKDQGQKEKILKLTSLAGHEVSVSEPYKTKKANSADKLDRCVILGVSVDVTEAEIVEETGAPFVKRIVRRNGGNVGKNNSNYPWFSAGNIYATSCLHRTQPTQN